MSLNINCGQGYFGNVELQKADVDSIKNNDIYAKLNYIFDRICDFICSTNRAEAKELLWTFLTSDNENTRAASFTRLKDLVSEQSPVSLRITGDDHGVRFSIEDNNPNGPFSTDNNLSLTTKDLSNINLSGANLEGAQLLGTNLEGANLFKANLASADLINVNFRNASLEEADLSNANLSLYFGTHIEQARTLEKANVKGTTLDRALEFSNFYSDLVKKFHMSY